MLAAVDSASTTNNLLAKAFSAVARTPESRDKIVGYCVEYGLKASAAILVVLVGMLIARWVGNATFHALGKREMEPPLRALLVRFVKLIILLGAAMMAVQQLGVQLLPLIAGLGIAGVGAGLAMQGVLSNLVAGLTIIFVKKFRVGEYIEIAGVQGQVENIELFSTTLVHADLSHVVVPNRKIVGEIIHNYGKIRQLDLSVGVAYGTDLTKALDVVNDILKRNPRVLKDPAPFLGTSALGDSSIVIAVKPWTSVTDHGAAAGEINKALVERFREACIDMPFPQREIRILAGSQLKNVA